MLCASTRARGEQGQLWALNLHGVLDTSPAIPEGLQRESVTGSGEGHSDLPPRASPPCTAREDLHFRENKSDITVKDRRRISDRASGSAPEITGPKFFQADLLEEQLDTHALHKASNGGMAFRDVSTKKRTDAKKEKVCIKAATWNLAGINTKDIETVFAHVVDCDVFALQEFPKQEAGWKIITGSKYHGIVYQNYGMYRGVGVLCRADRLQLLKKYSTTRGVWIQLRHMSTQQTFLVGSLHLPNNEPREEVARFLSDFLSAKPKGGLPTVLLGDFNVQFTWREMDGEVVPGAITAKWAALRQGMAEAGLQQAVPTATQMHTATFHSRKGTVASTQIDGAFVSGPQAMQLHIKEDSRHEAGTDHDRVEVSLTLPGGGARKERRSQCGGPRVVCSPPPPQSCVTQESLKTLANKHTKPLSLGPKFKPSPAICTLRRHGQAGQRCRGVEAV